MSNDVKRKYFVPTRDSNDRVQLIEVTQEQYYSIYPFIWKTRKQMQDSGQCHCRKKMFWKCDAHCDYCEFYHPQGISLDQPSSDSQDAETLSRYFNTEEASVEDILLDRLALEDLFNRLRELAPSADAWIDLWCQDPDMSDRAVARALGIPQRTFSDRIKKIRAKRDELLNPEHDN